MIYWPKKHSILYTDTKKNKYNMVILYWIILDRYLVNIHGTLIWVNYNDFTTSEPWNHC